MNRKNKERLRKEKIMREKVTKDKEKEWELRMQREFNTIEFNVDTVHLIFWIHYLLF